MGLHVWPSIQPGGTTEANWVYVGAVGAPAFQNGWANVGGAQVPMRYRQLPELDVPSGEYGIEIQGAVTGGAAGSVIFTLPVALDYDLRLTAADSAGSFVVLTVKANGDVVYGFV